MKKFYNSYLKNNKLNTLTSVVIVIGFVGYVIGFCVLIGDKTIEKILALTVDYVTVFSCIIAMIQLIAFVKDARYKEMRCRKEAALNLAKDYADNLVDEITGIINVLSVHYNPKNTNELYELLKNQKLNEFTKIELNKHSELKKYVEIFETPTPNIKLETLLKVARVYQTFDLSDISTISDEAKETYVNQRFMVHICETMNKLEYFAMAINQNIAESDMLFVSLHQTFNKFILFMYPYICWYNETEECYYTNIIKLFNNWSNKRAEIDCSLEENEKKRKEMYKKKHDASQPL